MQINLHHAVTSLTSALDFVGVDTVHHGKRVALMAGAIAAEMGWRHSLRQDMTYAGMLHDCGVSRMREHRRLTETLEWDGAQEHSLRGAQYLLDCPPLARFASIVRWHHTRWEQLLDETLDDDERLQGNLIFLADRIDVLLAPYVAGTSLRNEILWEYPDIVERIAGLGGTLFSPELVEAFRRVSRRESFWLCMDPSYIEDEIWEELCDSKPVEVATADALSVSSLLARTVDAKSSYTLDHSTRVASISRRLAEATGIDGEELDKVEMAGLLHDIGKLRVPEEIIDKPGALTLEERAYVMRHSFDTGHILKRIFPGQPIADWARMHHENLLGTGYPERYPASAIPREARLISVADIFQALAQARPYRTRRDSHEVMAQLDKLRELGRIDPEMVELLRANVDECYSLAVD